jgi:hypothetical protein
MNLIIALLLCLPSIALSFIMAPSNCLYSVPTLNRVQTSTPITKYVANTNKPQFHSSPFKLSMASEAKSEGVEPKYIAALVVFLLAALYDKMVMHGGF